MNRFRQLIVVFLTLTTLSFTAACNRDATCPAYKDLHVKTDKNGQLKAKRGTSNLFPKDMRKH